MPDPRIAPVRPAVPAVTLTLPARCTVAELRALLRQVQARAELVDAQAGDDEHMIGVHDLRVVALTFELPHEPTNTA